MINDIHCLTYTPIVPLCNLIKDRIDSNVDPLYPGEICQSCVYGKDALKKYTVTTEHLQQWLTQYGRGYDSLKAALDYAEKS